jgi:hypothetical protein
MVRFLSLLEKKKFLASRKDYNSLALLKDKKAQMKIQQMAFMILAVFLFFVLVGLFFLAVEFRGLKEHARVLEEESAISSLKVISDMTELNYDSKDTLVLDEDKLRILSGTLEKNYESLWPVSSIKVHKIYPAGEIIKCPSLNCNYYEIYNSGQKNIKEYSTYVSVCKRIKEFGYIYDKCEIGKLSVGVKINE